MMKHLSFTIFTILLIANVFSENKIIYREPCPGADFINIDNNIIIGFEKQIHLNESELLQCIAVTGSISNFHDGTIIICADKRKIIFEPQTPFDFGEKVTVKLTGKLLNGFSAGEKSLEYSFSTSSQKVQWNSLQSLEKEMGHEQQDLFDPPQLTVTVDNNPSSGNIFLAPFAVGSFLIITNMNGSTYWYRQITDLCGDFKKQPNGHTTYFDGGQFKHFEMDTNYNIVNFYNCANGYVTDIHELRVLNNGHAYLLAYDPQIVDMSVIIPGGNPHAIVTGLIIQEIDENKNVVFQWRSWDHFSITDATHENLLDSIIDYVHGNSIEIDNDSNLIISSRNMDEITKINRTTGAIIWRWGGKKNQFTFISDPIRFSHQHAARRISNGNITLYDNGNFHTPQFSRAVEYSLNEQNKTATLVWQYRNTPAIYGYWGGYVQRLSGGNTFICWGGTRPTITEVEPNGNVVFEASYPLGVFTYRAYKFDWNGNPVSLHNENDQLPKEFKLFQNYPNPFNPQTTISFDIPKDIDITLIVYDVLGKEVYKISEFKKAGSYNLNFSGSDLSSGIYYYSLTAGTYKETKKMILIK